MKTFILPEVDLKSWERIQNQKREKKTFYKLTTSSIRSGFPFREVGEWVRRAAGSKKYSEPEPGSRVRHIPSYEFLRKAVRLCNYGTVVLAI